MREIIIKTLSKISECHGNDCQINLGSPSAQTMIADELIKELDPHVQQLIEDIVCPPSSSIRSCDKMLED